MDAVDFILLIFLSNEIAKSFHIDLEKITLVIFTALVVRLVGTLLFVPSSRMVSAASRY
ncbi:hypothetical protein [Burkholderia singularis]|uniref:hypothetical protein n=1 Tax=Burkholderia singularis TaxID=1503053 RepID=UPI0018D32C1C|nr:hypothetical protein [Burkholderia sp. Bp7605]